MIQSILHAILGGGLIGASALLLYAGSGRIAGISGVAFGAFLQPGAERAWRVLFIVGLAGGAWVATGAGVELPAPATASTPSVLLALASGVLVGAGTFLGNGCTSGHGVCGLARLSRRSLWSVIVFMACGMAAATLLRPWLTP